MRLPLDPYSLSYMPVVSAAKLTAVRTCLDLVRFIISPRSSLPIEGMIRTKSRPLRIGVRLQGKTEPNRVFEGIRAATADDLSNSDVMNPCKENVIYR